MTISTLYTIDGIATLESDFMNNVNECSNISWEYIESEHQTHKVAKIKYKEGTTHTFRISVPK